MGYVYKSWAYMKNFFIFDSSKNVLSMTKSLKVQISYKKTVYLIAETSFYLFIFEDPYKYSTVKKACVSFFGKLLKKI